MISFSNLRGYLTLTEQPRVVFVEQEEPYIRTVFFKPASFAASALANNGDGFFEMDSIYADCLRDDNSRKTSHRWTAKNGRVRVFSGYSLFGPSRPGGGFERYHSGMNGPGEERRAISDALLYVESHPGEFPDAVVLNSVRT